MAAALAALLVVCGEPDSTSPSPMVKSGSGAPNTPTVRVMVFDPRGEAAGVLGSSFSSDYVDTHAETVIQVDSAGGDFSNPRYWNVTLGAARTDTVTGLDSAAVAKARLRYSGTSGGWSAWSDTVQFVASRFPQPDILDDTFDDGVSGSWTGTVGTGQIDLVTDPTGSFGGRRVAKHAFSVASGDHVDDPVYRYLDNVLQREVYVAIDFELTNATRDSVGPQRKLIYLKGDRNYGGGNVSWSVILTEWGSVDGLYLNGDPGNYGDAYLNQLGTAITEDTPYRLELGVYVNSPGRSDGWTKVWLTDLEAGPASRRLISHRRNVIIDQRRAPDHAQTVDRIEVGHQLDNGGYEGLAIADDRIFDRIMISTQEIGTWGLEG